jgi:glycosyltransferase involved in cell wall biosynthesis
MKISVVMVCYNAEKTIGYSIDSFVRQTYPNKELIVIDGASSDRTLEMVSRFESKDIVILSESDRGLYDAMNKGIARFSGDAVGFLNADDRYHDQNVLGEVAEALKTAEIVYGNVNFVANHESDQIVRRWRGSKFYRGAFKRGWMAAHPSFYVRREVASAVGNFDIKLKIAADYDYMLRALELQNFQTCFLDQVLVDMMTGGSSTAGIWSYLQGNRESLRARQRWLGSGIIDFAVAAKPLRKIGQFVPRSA